LSTNCRIKLQSDDFKRFF